MTIKSKTTRYLRTSLIFALLLLSNLRLLAYSIPEIIAKAKPAVVKPPRGWATQALNSLFNLT
jgi:hypothetical protein